LISLLISSIEYIEYIYLIGGKKMFNKNVKKICMALLILTMFISLFAGCGESKKITIGVSTGTTYQDFASKYQNVDIKTYKDDTITLWEVSNKRIDAIITDRLVGAINIKDRGYDNLKLAGDLLYKETIAVAIRNDDDTLRQAINAALADIIIEGTYANISIKYFGIDILDGVKYEKIFPQDEAAKDNSLQRVKDAGEITFAMSGGYPPFNYFNDEEELTGFDVEIGKEVAKKLGVKYTPITTDWSGILEGLRSGRYDGIFGSMAATEERLKVVDFTDPYYYSGAQLIVTKDSKIMGPDSLKLK
jgi:ABC-type amino acid transport substrate-binding protein